jgi:hypothetical protein
MRDNRQLETRLVDAPRAVGMNPSLSGPAAVPQIAARLFLHRDEPPEGLLIHVRLAGVDAEWLRDHLEREIAKQRQPEGRASTR